MMYDDKYIQKIFLDWINHNESGNSPYTLPEIAQKHDIKYSTLWYILMERGSNLVGTENFTKLRSYIRPGKTIMKTYPTKKIPQKTEVIAKLDEIMRTVMDEIETHMYKPRIIIMTNKKRLEEHRELEEKYRQLIKLKELIDESIT